MRNNQKNNLPKIKVTSQAVKKIKGGYPLLITADIAEKHTEKTILWCEFVSPQNEFVASGYIGKQNKGIGWVLSFDKNEKFLMPFFEKMFAEAKEKRCSFFNEEGTNAFRIFNGEGDGIGGLTIDYYAAYAVVSWYNETIYQKKAEVIEALQKVYPEVQGIYEKVRFPSNHLPESQFVAGSRAADPLIIMENGIRYAVYLDEGLMTGIFLDQKEVRNYLTQGIAIGKRVLNTFSYTGAFSVAAAMGGAAVTTSVDLAKRSLPKTQEQFLINGFDVEQQQIVVMDIFEYFRYAVRKKVMFDLVVLDPPSFARNKKQVFSVAKNYHELVTQSCRILVDGGILIASTNAANVSLQQFKDMVAQGFRAAEVKGEILQIFRLPADFTVKAAFKEGNYLKVICYKIKK